MIKSDFYYFCLQVFFMKTSIPLHLRFWDFGSRQTFKDYNTEKPGNLFHLPKEVELEPRQLLLKEGGGLTSSEFGQFLNNLP